MVLRVLIAHATNSAHGRQALFEGREPAVLSTAHAAAAVKRTPWIVLRRGVFAHRGYGNDNSKRK
jgi:hypothetical protein